MKPWIAKSILLLASSAIALSVAEVVSRLLYPISAEVRNETLDGRPITNWLTPSTTYRQISSEFNAITTITENGHRTPAAEGNPDVVFIGDSFTFGWGLSDQETFASLYCRALRYSCANLGAPGTGTIEQLDILERSLHTWEWKPKEVKLFIFAMTSSFLAGNDLADNFNYHHSQRAKQGQNKSNLASEAASEDTGRGLSLFERIVAFRYVILAHSNLIRIAKYHWGPFLKSAFSPGLDQRRLTEALNLTHQQFERLAELGKRHGFNCSVYLLHPIQDIIRGTHNNTLLQLSEISPFKIEGTAHLFVNNPEDFYYTYDGHLNKRGSATIAELLVAHEARRDVPAHQRKQAVSDNRR